MNDKIKRLLAAIIDFYIICFLSSTVVLVFTVGELNITPFSITIYLISCILLALFKDFTFKNASIGKRIFKLQVIETNGRELKLFNILKRNVPVIVLLPVEVILLIIGDKRIGDIWAKTSVIHSN